MDRTQENLWDRKDALTQDLMKHYSNLVYLAADRVGNKSATGQSATTSTAINIETSAMVKTAEKLLALTRQIRELYTIGRIHKPGEGEQEAEAITEAEIQRAARLLDGLRNEARTHMVSEGGGYGEYAVGPLRPPQARAAAPNTASHPPAASSEPALAQ